MDRSGLLEGATMIVFQLLFTVVVWCLYAPIWLIGRCILCPLGCHVTGWEMKSSRALEGKMLKYRHIHCCAFCDREKDMLK